MRRRAVKRIGIGFLAFAVTFGCVASILAVRGRYSPPDRVPTGAYRDVSFESQARDHLRISGWFLPVDHIGKAAILVHGWGGNRETLLGIGESLQRQGVAVLTVDLRGGTGRNSYGVYEAGDVAGAAAWLESAYGVQPASLYLIANSMGGLAVMGYASSHEVGGLVLMSSVYDLNHSKQYFAKDFHLIFPSLYAWISSGFDALAYHLHPIDPKQALGRVSAPILALHGTDDQKAPLADARAALTPLSGFGSRVRLETVGGGHTFYEVDGTARAWAEERIDSFVTAR